MSEIRIPAAALEAGAEAFLECDRSPACSFEDALRSAFLAMMGAWPGKDIVGYGPPFYGIDLILPLTEKTDDKA